MTKKLITLVILLLGCILLYTFSTSHSFTNNRISWPIYLNYETHMTTDAISGVERLGDADANNLWNSGDVIYLINYLFKSGPAPKVYDGSIPNGPPKENDNELTRLRHGDANDDCHITVSDVIYLINYLFKGGPTPFHSPPPLHAEQCCCVVYGSDSTKCDLSKCK